MAKKKVLFTGGSGLLALNWASAIQEEFDVVLGFHQKAPVIADIPNERIQLESRELFSKNLEKIKPDLVVHCAGLANVEACEADPANAYHVNVALTENVATACKDAGSDLIYIATDHLFSGKKPLVTEEESAMPVNEYGKTKWLGERKALEINENSLSIRTNFYGWGPAYRRSFSDVIIDQLSAGKPVSLFDDFYYTPIVIDSLAKAVMDLWKQGAAGVYNVAGGERLSKLAFGQRIAAQFGLDSSLIRAAHFADRKDLVKRPSDLSLDNSKAAAFLNRSIGNIQQDIEHLFQQKQSGLASRMAAIQ